MHSSRFFSLTWLLFIIGLTLPTVRGAQPQAGSLDLSFNGTGIWTGIVNGVEARAQESVVLPDGKIIVVGEHYSNPYRLDALIQRHLSDGTLDTSFGTQGRLVLPQTTSDRMLHAVTLQPDGKILAVGWMRTELSQYVYKVDILALRLMPDGTPDASFGSNGLATTTAPNQTAYIYDVAVQTSGKILLAGRGANSRIGAFRLNEDGALDTSFANQGASLAEYGSFSDIQDMELLPDGRIILVGHVFRDSKMSGLMICLNADGTPDTRFGLNGIIEIAFNNATETGFAKVHVLPDGRLLTGGYGLFNNKLQIFLARYGVDRTLDTTFGEDGISLPVFGVSENILSDLAVTDSGHILVSSSCYPNGSNQFSQMGLARFLPNGAIETSFGEGGQIALGLTGNSAAFALTQASPTQWLLSGYAYEEEGNVVALARILTGPPSVILKDDTGTPLDDGAEITFNPVATSFTSQRHLEIYNPGGEGFTDVRIAIEGTGFELFPEPSTPQIPQGKTTYTLRFKPTGDPGPHTAVLKVIQGTSATPHREIRLAGKALSSTEDSDADGLNDVTEFKLEALGFDPFSAQPDKVALLFGSLGEAKANLNAAGYHTPGEIAELHANTLLERDSHTGQMVLRLSLEQSTDLTRFVPFPLDQNGVTITAEGRLEFRFTPSPNRSFYRFSKP